MQDIVIQRATVNVPALDAELRNALGDAVYGLSVGPGKVVVHLADGATPADLDQAGEIVDDHDAAVLTPDQQAQLDLAAERESYAAPLDPQAISLEDLARRVAWLERELRAWRGI